MALSRFSAAEGEIPPLGGEAATPSVEAAAEFGSPWEGSAGCGDASGDGDGEARPLATGDARPLSGDVRPLGERGGDPAGMPLEVLARASLGF